jgi:hypothetical protein
MLEIGESVSQSISVQIIIGMVAARITQRYRETLY